jgi:MAP/microtubule affinity-regulating kinase
MTFSTKTSLDEYIIGKQIGQGAYAVVRIGIHKPSNKKVALKIYKKYKLLDPNRRKSVKREIKLMEKMKHPNIARLYETIDTEKYVILVMEYVGGGSLHSYLKSKAERRLDEQEVKRVFKQVLEAIKYCHSRCITHRDIKLENVLLDDQCNIKLIDFGFSTCIPNDKKIKIFCGTPSYMGPEIVNKTEYAGPPADIWALGVLLFTIMSGCFPYRGATDKELYKRINRADYILPSEVYNSVSAEGLSVLRRIFNIEPEKRPTAREILHDEWFTKQPKQQEGEDIN